MLKIQLLKDALHPIVNFGSIMDVDAQLHLHTSGQSAAISQMSYKTYLALVEQALRLARHVVVAGEPSVRPFSIGGFESGA